MAEVRFVVNAQVAKAVSELLKVSAAEARMGQAAEAAARQATSASRQHEAAYQRVGRAADAAAARQTRQVLGQQAFINGFAVRRADLATTQTMRAIGRGGAVDSSSPLVQQAVQLAADRQARANFLRLQRTQAAAADRIAGIRGFQSSFFEASEGRLGALEVAQQVRAAANNGMLDSASIDLAARGIRVLPGGGRYQVRAMRDVARNIQGTPELAGRVDASTYETMVGQRASQLERTATLSKAAFTTTGFVVGAAVAQFVHAFDRIHETLDHAGRAAADFEKEMTPLLSLGENTQNIRGLKEQVLSGSVAWGMDRAQIAASMFSLQSGTANLSGKTRGQIFSSGVELTRVTGGDLNTNLTALIKSYQVYEKEVGSVDKAQAKLFKTIQDGFVTAEDLSTLLPDILPAAKAMGITFDEVLGSVITATQVGGRNEKTFTGLREVYLKLSEAQKEGIKLTGTFADKMKQLSNAADGEKMQAIFGDRAITTAATLAQKSGELAANIRNVANTIGTETFQKFLDRQIDPGAADANMREGADELKKNIDLLRGQDPELRQKDLAAQFGEIGMESTVDKELMGLDPLNGVGGKLIRSGAIKTFIGGFLTKQLQKVGMDFDPESYQRYTVNSLIDKKLQAAAKGDRTAGFEAHRMQLQYGSLTGTALENGRFTNGEDAEAFSTFEKELHGNGSFRDFLQLQDWRESNPGRATAFTKFLHRTRGFGHFNEFDRLDQLRTSDPAAAAQYDAEVMTQAGRRETNAAKGRSGQDESKVGAAADKLSSAGDKLVAAADRLAGVRNPNAHA